MAAVRVALKKSVTIDPDVIEALAPDRRANLSATVNDGLQLLAALDSQDELVQEWEQEHGRFTDEELRPFLEAAIRAQVNHLTRVMRESRLRENAVRRSARVSAH